MTQLRAQTPEELDRALGHPKTRPFTIRLPGANRSATTTPLSNKDELARSLHSEPDIDTIMPLPGWGGAAPSAHAQMQNVASMSPPQSPTGERMSDHLSSEEEEEGEGGEHHPLHRQSSDFATIEVKTLN